MIYNYHDTLSGKDGVRYDKHLEMIGLQKCPYKIKGDAWISDIQIWLDIEYAQIFNYLINYPRKYPNTCQGYLGPNNECTNMGERVRTQQPMLCDITNFFCLCMF